MGGQTVPTVGNQPYAGISEFTLPARMRLLAARILSDLINPCRDQLTNALKRAAAATKLADREAAAAIKLADQGLASAEAKFRSVRDEQNKRLAQVKSKVATAVGELDQIRQSAAALLESEGVSLVSGDAQYDQRVSQGAHYQAVRSQPEGVSTPSIESTARQVPEVSDASAAKDLDEILSIVRGCRARAGEEDSAAADLDGILAGGVREKASLQSLCQRKNPSYWRRDSKVSVTRDGDTLTQK